MAELPAELRPWREQLSLLPRDLALSLGPHVARLALAVGPLPSTTTGGVGDPDGYGGLGRRGRYERLLIGEWALAELWPEEFDRRAAAGEHSFLELATDSRAGARRSVVLLDAGPSQLGGPRIVHLAALLALQGRASKVGAELHWGIVQRLGDRLRSGVDASAVEAFLAGRSAREATDALVEAWAERLSPGAAIDDWWLVGSTSLVTAARRAGAACLAVEDVVAPGPRRIRADLHRGGRRPTRLWFSLPDREACARLLRDPLRAARARKRSADVVVDAGAPVRLSADGRRVLVRDDRGGFVAWPIPSSPRATPGRLRRFPVPPGSVLTAAGARGRRHLAITARLQDGVPIATVHGVGHPITAGPARRFPAATVTDDGLPLCGVVRTPAGPVVVWCRDRILSVTTPPVSDEPVGIRNLIGGVLDWSVGPEPEGITVVRLVEGRYRVAVLYVRAPDEQVVAEAPAPPEPAAFIGHDPHSHPVAGPVALRIRPGVWRVSSGDGRTVQLHPPPAMTVVGAARVRDAPGLIVVGGDERELLFAGRRGIFGLCRTRARIVSACASAAAPQAAWLTEDGEVGVVSLRHEAPVLRIQGQVVE